MVGSLGWWAGEREGLRQASPVPAIAQGGTTSQVVSFRRCRVVVRRQISNSHWPTYPIIWSCNRMW